MAFPQLPKKPECPLVSSPETLMVAHNYVENSPLPKPATGTGREYVDIEAFRFQFNDGEVEAICFSALCKHCEGNVDFHNHIQSKSSSVVLPDACPRKSATKQTVMVVNSDMYSVVELPKHPHTHD